MEPAARPCRCNGRRARFGYGVREQALERLGELLELVLAVERDLDPAAPTFASKPVSRRTASRDAVRQRRIDGASPAAPSCARRPSGRRAPRRERTGPSRTIRRASRRRPSWSGTASTARAWPSVSSPRPTIASTSSGSSSRRMRFETAGFERPTRSATSPSESPNSSISTRVRARLLDRREVLARDVLDEAEQERVAVVRLADDRRHGREPGLARGAPAALAGDQLVAALRPRADDDRLDHALRADRLGEAGVASCVEAPARLARVRVDLRRPGAARARAPRRRRSAPRSRGRGRGVGFRQRSTSSIATFQ